MAEFHDPVVLNGELTPLAEATIPVSDEGFLRGDGVFEAIRLYGGKPFALDEHLERLQRSAGVLSLPVDIETLRTDCETLLGQTGEIDAVLRTVVTRGGNRLVVTHDLQARNQAMRLIVLEHAIVPLLINAKTLSYGANMLATRMAADRGFDEAILVDADRNILEAPRSALMWFNGDKLGTASLDTGILDSITRRRIATLRDVDTTPTPVDDLATATEVFIADTPFEITPVSEIEGIATYETPGAETAKLSAELSELIRGETEAQSAQ